MRHQLLARPRAARSLRLLAAWALLAPLVAFAQIERKSLFTTEARAPEQGGAGGIAAKSAIDEPVAAGRSRIAKVDRDGLNALHGAVASGRPGKLRLNLLHNVEYETTIERSVPTASGYTLSGPIDGVPFGRAVLVVNGARVMGRVYTPQGAWAIRTTGALQTVERMERKPLKCAAHPQTSGGTGFGGGKRPAAVLQPFRAAEAAEAGRGLEPGAGLAGNGPPVRAAAKSATGDDGVVDLLVVYPSFAREIEGGYGPMLSLIDLDIATANEAYAASGVDLRVDLAAAVEVEYDWFLETNLAGNFGAQALWIPAVEHLSGKNDGYLDEVHALRAQHAADLVLLHLGGKAFEEILAGTVGGIARAVFDVTAEALEAAGFSVALSGDGTTVAHEIGHSMGLHHDRHEHTGNRPFPYSHGFRYRYEKTPGTIYGTIMSTYSSVDWEGYVLAFSNPDLSHPLVPGLKLGVPGDEPSSASDGPADAARHLNELRGVIANVRARADADPCRYQLSGDGGELPPEGGTFRLRVETGADCAWAASRGEWVSSVSPAAGTGSGEIEVVVARNDNWERPAEVLVAGRLHTRRQVGSRPITPVCERAFVVLVEILNQVERLHPQYDYSQFGCSDYERLGLFDAETLASIRTFHPPDNFGYSGFDASLRRGLRPGDFDGLTGVYNLKINSMEHLPPDMFAGLTGLRVLEFVKRRFWEDDDEPTLTTIAPGAFGGLPRLKRLEIVNHRLRRLEAGTFEGLSGLLAMEMWPIGDGRLVLEPGVFDGLSSLRSLLLPGNGLRRLEAGVFDGLGELRRLMLINNSLASLPVGVFDGLSKLKDLDVGFNRITALRVGLFDGLTSLEELYLGANRIAHLDPRVFPGLPSLRSLSLSDNRLTAIPKNLFENLAALEFLGLESNELTALEPGTFANLANLRSLSLAYNSRLSLEPGAFDGLSQLGELFLTDTGLQAIPDGLFAGLGSLHTLSLAENRLGAVQAGAFDGLDRLIVLNLFRSGVTSFEPGLFDATPTLRRMTLQESRIRELAPGMLRGLALADFDLRENPGSPFTFAPTPVVVAATEMEPMAGQPLEVAVEVASAAPFNMDVVLAASSGAVSKQTLRVAAGETRGEAVTIVPDGNEPVTVSVDGTPLVTEAGRNWCSGRPLISGLTRGHCYRGVRVAAGPPLELYGIANRSLTLGRGSDTVDLVGVFSYFLGFSDYAAESSDGAVAAVAVEDGALTVTPGQTGTAQVTVTATAPDGETMTRRFTVAVGVPSVPLFLSDADPEREGFVRLVNLSERAGDVQITAVDDAGSRRGPVRLRLRANGAAHFNSGDLEGGNDAKGLAEGIGLGEGGWRLEFETDLEVEALSYVRTADGFVTSVHDAAPVEGGVSRIATFNPASNDRQASRLRVVNPGREPAQVTVRGVDDAGASPGGPVRFTVPAGAAREFGALQLEAGDAELEGALGDGEGKWRLTVESDEPVAAMSLLESTATGHLTNLSSGPRPPDADGAHHVPLMPAASDANGREGFVRVINRSGRAGTVRIAAFDGAGTAHGPLELSVGAGAAAHFNASDLEFGNAAKGLSGSAGPPGEGDWRLELTSGLDIEVLAYVRTEDGFLTAMHEAVAVEDGRRRVAFFNPGSNTRQVSRLRLVNPLSREAVATIQGTDDAGGSPDGVAWVTVPARGALTLSAAELEAGVPSETFGEGHWDQDPLRDGTGKWRFSVATEPEVQVMSLLESPTGHLTNLSSGGR